MSNNKHILITKETHNYISDLATKHKQTMKTTIEIIIDKFKLENESRDK